VVRPSVAQLHGTIEADKSTEDKDPMVDADPPEQADQMRYRNPAAT